jgi:hypothetical protein
MAKKPNQLVSFKAYKALMQRVLSEFRAHAPGLAKKAFIHGSMPISIAHTQHCVSMDIDLASKRVHDSLLPELTQLKKAYGRSMDVYEVDREFGMGRAQLKASGVIVSLDMFASFEPVPAANLEASKVFKGFTQINLPGYIENKLAILTERHQAKDLFHLCCLVLHPDMKFKGLQERIERELSATDLALIQGDAGTPEFKAIHNESTKVAGTKAPSLEAFRAWMGQLKPQKRISDIGLGGM